jgi:H+/Cl- antiporter ClcA/CBS domain-containing protein
LKASDEYAGVSPLEESPGRIKRTLYISGLALLNAIAIGFIAKGLLFLINFVTNLSFYGRLAIHDVSPASNDLGYWVIGVPVIGGVIVGIMARFGSKAIRGHGIPEAMEQVIRNESKIHPVITILKPLSSAVAIGTGGPFGAEGPIISTGGALGSFCGQTLRITAQERKVLLAAGATSGMTAIFGTPFAAILLAIELLLFEFSARSFIPVMVACVTGACMHFLLFGILPTFPMPDIISVDSHAVVACAVLGLVIGVISVVVTRTLYIIEDTFEKLPIHWMWWPALGGIVVGVIGTFAPDTLGVGYENITHALSGKVSIPVLVSLCLWKFVSWGVALGSGTSGGTLAPLLTIGSALGCLLGVFAQHYVPEAHLSLPLAALVGMAALFAGSARALLTAIVFALESTMQERTLLPLIAGCVTSYMVSFILMRGTIMTEKIKRRGVILPESFVPDLLEIKSCAEAAVPVAQSNVLLAVGAMKIKDLRGWFSKEGLYYPYDTVFIGFQSSYLSGTLSKKQLFESDVDPDAPLSAIMSRKVYSIYEDNSLKLAVEFMLKTRQNVLPVLERSSRRLVGFVSEHDILITYEQRLREDRHKSRHISMVSTTLKAFNKGKNFLRGEKW